MVLDGAIVRLPRATGPEHQFQNLLFRRDWPYFYAFDLLAVDGEDLRDWPLIERKRRLRQLIPSVPTRLLYVDHIKARGKDFFEVACAHDLEGLVAKSAKGRYHADGASTNWIRIFFLKVSRNFEYFGSSATMPSRLLVNRSLPSSRSSKWT
jgi:bifunctional non-homologous end joining protein LigD